MAVTVDEVKAHLRIQHDEEDGFILSLIAQAQAAAEDYCRVEFAEDAPQPVRPAFDTRSEDAYDEIRRVLRDELLK